MIQVRGAPAIAIVGCLSLAVELSKNDFNNLEDLKRFVFDKLEFLVSARPTAVNMADASSKGKHLISQICEKSKLEPDQAKMRLIHNYWTAT